LKTRFRIEVRVISEDHRGNRVSHAALRLHVIQHNRGRADDEPFTFKPSQRVR
jgi:hypothetical protein